MSSTPNSREQYSAHIPALHMLCNLGWNFLTTAQALALRGSTREVLLKARLVEVLQTRRYGYKGQWYPLSSSGIEQIVRELSNNNLAEGLMSANERLYGKLALGITDASRDFEAGKNQNALRDVDLQRILDAAAARRPVARFSHLATLSEIAGNDFNLNIPRYVDTFEEEAEIDLVAVRRERQQLKEELARLEVQMDGYLKELGYE